MLFNDFGRYFIYFYWPPAEPGVSSRRDEKTKEGRTKLGLFRLCSYFPCLFSVV